MALLEAMKAHVGKKPEARSDFRADVQTLLEVWDGVEAFLWLTWKEGTRLVFLGRHNARRSHVWSIKRDFESSLEEALGGKLFMVAPSEPLREEPYYLESLSVADARGAMLEYYDEKEPLR
jgi:hypothetical protein